MKSRIILLLCALVTNSLTLAKPLQLNADNLTMLALKRSSDEVISDYAKSVARSKHIKEYFKYIKDKEKQGELIQRVKKELLAELAQFPANPEFSVSQTVKLQNFNKNTSTFDVAGFSNDIATVFRKNKKNKGLPEYFFLLYANREILQNVKLKPKYKDKFNQSTKYITGFMQTTLLLPAYQNQQEFQVVIKDIKIYSDEKHQQLLAQKSEKRAAKKIISTWLLEDGFTNKLVGIHAFSLFGYRLQDMMSNINSIKSYCKKTKKYNKHHVVECKQKYSENISLIGTYVGGKFAQLTLIANKKPQIHEKDRLINQLSIALKQAKSFFKQNQMWKKYGVDFDYHADAFSDKGTLQSVFAFNTSNKQHGIIFTMISQATKKLIEKNK